MSVSYPDQPKRTRAFAVWSVAVCLVQAGALFALSRPSPAAPVESAPPPSLVVLGKEDAVRLIERFPDSARDLFSSIHPHGFSGDAWTRISARSRPVIDVVATHPLYARQTNRLGGAFSGWFAANGEPPFPMASKPPPAPPEDRGPSRPAPPPVTIEIPSGFDHRKPRQASVIPPIAHTNVLRATVARIGVDAEGRVVAKRVVESSDWASADREALRLIGELAFEPLKGGERKTENGGLGGASLQWGTVVVPWVVVPPEIPSSPEP